MRIYIIGQVGSGKTTLANKLSKRYKIKHYELDKVVWNDKNNTKRSNEEQIKLLNKIISKKSWIIEDVGRSIFNIAYDKCDKIYYLKIPSIILYYRVTKRWIRQLLRLEKSDYKQDICTLIQNYKWIHSGLNKEKNKLNILKKYKSFELLTIKDIRNI